MLECLLIRRAWARLPVIGLIVLSTIRCHAFLVGMDSIRSEWSISLLTLFHRRAVVHKSPFTTSRRTWLHWVFGGIIHCCECCPGLNHRSSGSRATRTFRRVAPPPPSLSPNTTPFFSRRGWLTLFVRRSF